MPEGGYFSFHKLISTDVVKALYVIGAVVITLSGIGVIIFAAYQLSAVPDAPKPVAFLQLASALAGLLIGNILWRMICESMILFFSMHELLSRIERRLAAAGGDGVDMAYLARQLHGMDQNAEARHREAVTALRALRSPQR